MSQRENIQSLSSANQDPTDLINKIIFTEPQKTTGRRRATIEPEVLRKISILRIEYLSLKNSSIKNLKFVKYFPNLWYLDVRNNLVK
jgi:hypothetical protein